MEKAETKNVFKDFCESTSLHGYSYLFIGNSIFLKIIWTIVILLMTCVGAMFLMNNTVDYWNARLVTTIESSSAPLKEAVWPSIVVCNLNQVEASFLKRNDVYGDVALTRILVKEFIEGHEEELTPKHAQKIKKMKESFGSYSFLQWSRQKCKDLFISVSFRGKLLTWKDFPQDWKREADLGPYLQNNDFGACCKLIPHFAFEGFHSWTLDDVDKFHNLLADARNGEAFGLDIVVNAEQFNYGFRKANAAGFTFSLLNHKDLAMMEFGSTLLQSGTETQINVKPTVSYATKDAISTFAPEIRDCYVDGEANMTYLQYTDGFRYELTNCIINEVIRDIIWNCRCLPRFFYTCTFCKEDYLEFLDYCSGKGLLCANTRMKSMGSDKIDEENNVIAPEALENPDLIGNIPKPKAMNCLTGCKEQTNAIEMSFAPYPQREVFFYQKTFCRTASHIWQVTCQDEDRKYFIKKKQPMICDVLSDFDAFFGKASDCQQWPGNFAETYSKPNVTLLEELYEYGSQNLALVHVVMQSPYVTKIKRDVAMTFTTYVANTGGLLGLCLGFSLISIFEIIFWVCQCCRQLKKTIGGICAFKTHQSIVMPIKIREGYEIN